MTSRSPYLLSVLNMGASVLTSHRYLQYSVQYSAVQYSTVQYSTAQHSTVPAGAGHAELCQVEVRGVAAAGVDVDPGPGEHGHGGAAGGQVAVDLEAALHQPPHSAPRHQAPGSPCTT